MPWNAEQYLKFSGQRLRPALDLLAQVALDAPRTIYDLGCGTGAVTQIIAERWRDADVIGVDDSAEMLERTRGGRHNVHWLRHELATWVPRSAPDLIYSNAALHWLGDHAGLFPKLLDFLAPGGVLAVQMPSNFSAPSHLAIHATVQDGPWREQLEPLLRLAPVADPIWYLDRLAPLACEVDFWETEYLQVLAGDNPVKEWTKGSWLKPFLDALAVPEREAFERAYAARVVEAYPPRPDGTTVFPFRRLFMVLRKPR
jgi:trans-aconitate 2-methyltransferase